MQKYQVLDKAGSGNFSEVFKARNLLTDQVVAIKQMRNTDDIQQLVLRQLKIAATLDHPNIIKLKQILRSQREIRVVFEYVEENLLELYTSSKFGINEHQLRCILYQSALGLEYLHRYRIIHRDIKPENILINRKTALVKLIDFGLAKEEYAAETDYVATRWYRSPENLIGMKKSTVAIDIFALGCVAVELFTLTPLFPGSNTVDQLSKIFSLLGTPTAEDWPKGYSELKRKNLCFGYQPKLGIGCVMQNASPQLLDLLDRMLQLNPQKRITARQMVFHPFFRHIQRVIPEHVYKQAQRLKDQIDAARSRNKSSLLTHKNMNNPSPSRVPYEGYSKDKRRLETVESMQFPSRSREKTKLLMSTNLEDPERRGGSNSRANYLQPDCHLKVPTQQKRFNYLSHQNLSPTQSTQSKISYFSVNPKPYNPVALQRPNILNRESKLNLRVPNNYSRVIRNQSMIQESALVRSIERMELNRSQPKVQVASVSFMGGNKTASYNSRRPLHY